MAHGPCGEDFKAAFSCFVYSEAEPKGMDCIDKFQHMQDCFRQYPEIYGAELQDDDDDDGEGGAPPATVAGAGAAGAGDALSEPGKGAQEPLSETARKAERQLPAETPETTKAVHQLRKEDEEEHPGVPRAAVDATDANEGKTTGAPVQQ